MASVNDAAVGLPPNGLQSLEVVISLQLCHAPRNEF